MHIFLSVLSQSTVNSFPSGLNIGPIVKHADQAKQWVSRGRMGSLHFYVDGWSQCSPRLIFKPCSVRESPLFVPFGNHLYSILKYHPMISQSR